MVDGQQRGRPPKEEVVVDMVDALERPGSDLPTGDQLMQKKGRTWEGSIVAKDSFLETVNGDIDAQPEQDADEAVNVKLVDSNERNVIRNVGVIAPSGVVDVGLDIVKSQAELISKESSKVSTPSTSRRGPAREGGSVEAKGSGQTKQGES
ncbi:hypothetical protein V6N12_031326 [Hibiscus sabdariffa]|uniref:Uncharacterized protein n=1 Tax=Hibiscus sabdariffa TaxID=183260 RepID=A0ABR2E8L8_9ROSI